MNKKLFGVLLIILLLGVGVYIYMTKNDSPPSPKSEAKIETQRTINIDNETRSSFNSLDHNSLTINTQTLSDVKNFGLTANDIYFEKAGFVIISDIKNDEPNNVIPNDLGLFDPGRVFENVAITTPIEKGTYFAQLYEDDGDRVFNKQKDKVLPLYSESCSCYDDKFVVQFIIE